MNELKYSTVRMANAVRLPLFKNSKGEAAHTTLDGSDWSPGMWLVATLGELGELADARVNHDTVCRCDNCVADIKKETADVAHYLDIFARRALDEVKTEGASVEGHLLRAVARLGECANNYKKFRRGDLDADTFNLQKRRALHATIKYLIDMMTEDTTLDHEKKMTTVTKADPDGVDIGEAMVAKFNEVSERIGCSVRIESGEVVGIAKN